MFNLASQIQQKIEQFRPNGSVAKTDSDGERYGKERVQALEAELSKLRKELEAERAARMAAELRAEDMERRYRRF